MEDDNNNNNKCVLATGLGKIKTLEFLEDSTNWMASRAVLTLSALFTSTNKISGLTKEIAHY